MNVGLLPGVELFECILTERLEQLVPRAAVLVSRGHQHRLGHEVAETVDDIELFDLVRRDDRLCSLGIEAPGEHPQPVEHDPFAFSEQ